MYFSDLKPQHHTANNAGSFQLELLHLTANCLTSCNRVQAEGNITSFSVQLPYYLQLH